MDEKVGSGRYHIPNLERALRVVEYLSGQPQGATLTEIVAGQSDAVLSPNRGAGSVDEEDGFCKAQ